MKIGIDPGHYKIGVAFVEGDKLLFSAIVPQAKREILFSALRANDFSALAEYKCEGNFSAIQDKGIDLICLGDGTGHDKFAQELALDVKFVNEKNSTMEARGEYFKLHKPRFWQRFLPRGLWLPPRNIDDLAAYVIAKRGTEIK